MVVSSQSNKSLAGTKQSIRDVIYPDKAVNLSGPARRKTRK